MHGEEVEADTGDFAVDDLGELFDETTWRFWHCLEIGLLGLLLQALLYMTLAIHDCLLTTLRQEFSNGSNCPRLTGIIHTNTVVQRKGYPAIELHVWCIAFMFGRLGAPPVWCLMGE